MEQPRTPTRKMDRRCGPLHMCIFVAHHGHTAGHFCGEREMRTLSWPRGRVGSLLASTIQLQTRTRAGLLEQLSVWWQHPWAMSWAYVRMSWNRIPYTWDLPPTLPQVFPSLSNAVSPLSCFCRALLPHFILCFWYSTSFCRLLRNSEREINFRDLACMEIF